MINKLWLSTPECGMTGVGMAGQKMTDISLLFVSVLSSCSLKIKKE